MCYRIIWRGNNKLRSMAEPIPPKADRFVAYVDAALVQQVLDISKRKRESDIHYHSQANDFWTTMEVLERVAFCHCKTLRNLPIRLNRIPSDNAFGRIPILEIQFADPGVEKIFAVGVRAGRRLRDGNVR
jgi:hypothetical protein